MKNNAKQVNQYHLHIQNCPCGFKLVMEGYKFPWERPDYNPNISKKELKKWMYQ